MAIVAGSLMISACADSAQTPAPRGTTSTTAARPATPAVQTPIPDAKPPLCKGLSQLTRLVLMRDDAFPQNHVHFAFPEVVWTKDARAVRAVADALCSSRRFPKGVINCPLDVGITYYLAFTGPHARPPYVVTLDATGCTAVSGVGPVRWASLDVWKALGSAFHVSPHAFRGVGPWDRAVPPQH